MILHKRHKISLLAFCLLLALLRSNSGLADNGTDQTMLLFVGQDIEVLSLASKREESPAQAPAVAEVVHRDEFMGQGARTLSQILGRSPGFYMAEKEWGSEPYLRGIPNSVLFLYDTVPLSSGLSKTVHPIDYELSLPAIEKVEIVRGPASVLWGPDAFAGVVNVVPLSGRKFQGLETGLLYNTHDQHSGTYLNWGANKEAWDGFLSASLRQAKGSGKTANLTSFFDYSGDKPVPPEQRWGRQEPGMSHYLDVYGKLQFGDKASISGRYTDTKHPYSMMDKNKELIWLESNDLNSGYIKLDLNQDIDFDTKLRFTTHYRQIHPEQRVIDRDLTQNDQTFYAETLVDHAMLQGKGLLTAGLSYRLKEIEDAPIWDSYLPDYFGKDNKNFLPYLSTESFHNQVYSVFSQYRHKLGDFDLMLGARYDWHENYKDNLSCSAALVWSGLDDWTLKLLYASSYRTPFARQLLDESEPALEKSDNYSLEIGWQPQNNLSLGTTFFYNKVSHHIMEDPYAGLSEPNTQDIYGLELEADYMPFETLKFNAALSILNNSGPDENYKFIKYITKTEGPDEIVYDQFSHPYDPGAKTIFNLSANWQPIKRLNLYTGIRYFASRKLLYPKNTKTMTAPAVLLVDTAANFQDIFISGLDLQLSVRNLFNKHYLTPGTYSMIEGEPFSMQAMFKYKF